MNTNQDNLFGAYAPTQLPESDSPNQRVLRDGAAACNTRELLVALIGGRHADRAAQSVLAHFRTLARISAAPVPELADVDGMGEAAAIRLKTALELGRRVLLPEPDRPTVRTPSQAAQLLLPVMGTLEQEEVHTALLDARGRLIAIRMIYRGSLNACAMRMGEVYREAIRHNAASIIVAHNHPSGDPSPSADDVRVTRQLYEASKLLDIELVDHIIVAASRWVSLKERGLGFE